jgi:hypothetical protein
MNYDKPTTHIHKQEYEYVVSLGNKCPTTMILKKLNIYKESFPFDYIPTTPSLILKYLQNQDDFYPCHDTIRTSDDVWFGHFNTTDQYNTTIETFKRRFARLFHILTEKKKIVFVYTTEADIYNEMNNQRNDNYSILLQIVDYLKQTYEYTDFKLVCIHMNKTFPNTENINNYTIHVPSEYISTDMTTHIPKICVEYRRILEELCNDIFI